MSKDNKEAKKAAKAAKKEEKKANKVPGEGLDQASKQSLIKSIVAVVCVGAVCLTTTTNIGKISEAKVAAAEKMYGGSSSASSEASDDTSSDFSDTSFDDTSADVSTDDTSADASTDDTSADASAADTGSDADAGASSSDSGSTASTPAANDSKPAANTGSAQKSKAEIIKLYNDATAKAASKVAKFEKERNTVEKKYEAGVALKAFKSLVYTFMGVGDSNKFTKSGSEMDKDNYYKYLQASKLTDADVVSATYTPSGANYTIVLKLKDGSSSVKGGKTIASNNTALDRSGLACGQDDKDYWDHKTAQNLMAAIDDVPGCASADISEKYSNATITAVVNASTGNLVSITGKFDFHCDINNVMGSSGVAEASSTVVMKDFKW